MVRIEIQRVKESYYQSIKKALMNFSQTEKNLDLYALVFDCDSSVGKIVLRYGSIPDFTKQLEDFEKYADLYRPYGKSGLRGYQYDVGNFAYLDYKVTEEMKIFQDYYYYYMTGDFCWNWEECFIPEHVEELEKDCKKVLEEIVLYCIQKLKENFIKLNVTDDFIMYMCDHDQTYKEKEDMIKQTVDEKLFKKLLDYDYAISE